MVAKIKRVIVASMLDVDKNTERPVTIRRRNSLSCDVCFTPESGRQFLNVRFVPTCGSPTNGLLPVAMRVPQ